MPWRVVATSPRLFIRVSVSTGYIVILFVVSFMYMQTHTHIRNLVSAAGRCHLKGRLLHG